MLLHHGWTVVPFHKPWLNHASTMVESMVQPWFNLRLTMVEPCFFSPGMGPKSPALLGLTRCARTPLHQKNNPFTAFSWSRLLTTLHLSAPPELVWVRFLPISCSFSSSVEPGKEGNSLCICELNSLMVSSSSSLSSSLVTSSPAMNAWSNSSSLYFFLQSLHWLFSNLVEVAQLLHDGWGYGLYTSDVCCIITVSTVW